MKAEAVDSNHVQLCTTLGDVEYDIFLNDPEQVSDFIETVTKQSAVAQAEDVRRRL